MEIKGVLKQIHPVVQATETFKSRKVWITYSENPQYPQTLELELTQANVDKFNNIAIGSEVTCHINFRGREWTKDGKTSVFNKLECWKVEVVSGAKTATGTATQAQQPATQAQQPATQAQQPEETDSLPF